MTSRKYFFFLIVCIALFIIPSFARKRETGFLDRTVTVAGEIYRYQVYIPQDFATKKKWPVILFLHGVGEHGDDGLRQTDIGIAHAIRENES